MNEFYGKQVLKVIANDKPSEQVALAETWGIAIPVNSFGYTDYPSIKQRLARFALDMDNHHQEADVRDDLGGGVDDDVRRLDV